MADPRIRATLERQLAPSERPWPWVIIALVLTAGAVTLVLLATSGALESVIDKSFLGRELRGYTGGGLAMGALAVLLSLVAMLYSLRKRWLQERMPLGRSTMLAWLWIHVAIGAVALVAAFLHAGVGAISANLSTGKVLLAVFFLLIATGVVWRIVYAAVPSIAAPRIGNYARINNERRAEEQSIEIEKIAAGRSPDVRRLKEWIVEAERPLEQVGQAAATLPPDDRAALAEIHQLAGSRRRALQRMKLQDAYTRLLQRWRVLHVPLTIVFLPLLIWHVVAALELPARLSSVGAVPMQSLSGLHPAGECASCHKAITDQWRTSMHAHALTSPVTVAQHNQLIGGEYAKLASPDPQKICINCHGPVSTAIGEKVALPLGRALYDDALVNEGVGCTTCHQFDGVVPGNGSMGLSSLQSSYRAGSLFFGEYDDAVGNAFHRSAPTPLFKDHSDALCNACHDVVYDTDGDGKIVKGKDLVLQQTVEEFERWKNVGGKGTCLTCHMPAMANAARIAENASIPFEQDQTAPDREVHDHSFVGVDYPLDEVARSDPQKKARERLLREAGSVKLEDGVLEHDAVKFAVKITNTGSGHNFPTGLAFARQLWLEVIVKDGSGKTALSSGVLDGPDSDLCDASTMNDPDTSMSKLIKGCDEADPLLVNLQQKLVTRFQIVEDKNGVKQVDDDGDFKVEARDDAKETYIQLVESAPVPRTRPFDKQKLGALRPKEERKFAYRVPLKNAEGAKIEVRLLFRSLPPYMLRALAKDQGPGETPLGETISNLQIVEVDTAQLSLRP